MINILNGIIFFADLSQIIINGSDFIAVALSSEDIHPEEQINKGISAIDFVDCIKIVKQKYNISNDESLIILNIESKNKIDEIDFDKSFNLGKKLK